MKVIDFHVHPLVKEAFEEDKDLWNAQKDVFMLYTSPQPISTLINQLKEAEVEKAVLLPIDCSTKWNFKIPSNEIIAKIVSKFPEKFIGFASIDPNKEGAIEELEKSIKKLNLKGVKLNPAMQSFDPLSKKAKEIYDKINDMKLPLVVHTGMVWQSKYSIEYCNPIIWDKIAREYSEMKIILAHFGWPWIWEAAIVSMRNENVYLDISNTFTGTCFEHLKYLLTEAIPKRVTERFLSEKIVFGSDYPRIEIPKMVSAIKKLKINDEVKEKILYKNSLKILKI